MDFITTQTGNVISKCANIPNPQVVLISGHSTICHKVSLISDSLQLGKFVYISDNTEVNSKRCKIGSYVIIDSDCLLKCSNVGNRVFIGSNCQLEKNVVIHDCVFIKSNTVINENSNIPPFSIVEQDCGLNHLHSNCRLKIQVLNESFKKLMENYCKLCYINHEIPSIIP